MKLEQFKHNQYVLQFDGKKSVRGDGRSIPVCADNNNLTSIELQTSPSLEAIIDGAAFYGEAFLDELVNIILAEEKIVNPDSRVFQVKEISKVLFVIDSIDDHTYQPVIITTVYGVF